MDAAGPEIVGVETRPGGPLIEDHELFALFETPQRGRQGADVQRLGRDVQQMRQDAADFGVQDADQLAAIGHVEAEQPLDRETEGMLLIHRRDVVQPVEIGNVLEVGAGLHQLFSAAMQQADVGIDALDDLAVQLQHQTQYAVGSRVLGAEIDGELTVVHLPGMTGSMVEVVGENVQLRHGRRPVLNLCADSHQTLPPDGAAPATAAA